LVYILDIEPADMKSSVVEVMNYYFSVCIVDWEYNIQIGMGNIELYGDGQLYGHVSSYVYIFYFNKQNWT
jgi:hypothetical protein